VPDVLRVEDRWRRSIGLPEENWTGKILLDHGELEGNEESVEVTLADPDLVTFDRDHADREVFYRRRALPPPDDGAYLKVCVAFRTTARGDRVGRVVTAYATDGVKPGEQTKWTRARRTSKPRRRNQP
jgi:hypothetical protein